MRAAAGHLALLSAPMSSLWLNPIAIRWRQVRREAAHGESLKTKQALLAAANAFFDRSNQCPENTLSVIGSKAKKIV